MKQFRFFFLLGTLIMMVLGSKAATTPTVNVVGTKFVPTATTSLAAGRNILSDVIVPNKVVALEASAEPTSDTYDGIDERLELDSDKTEQSRVAVGNYFHPNGQVQVESKDERIVIPGSSIIDKMEQFMSRAQQDAWNDLAKYHTNLSPEKQNILQANFNAFFKANSQKLSAAPNAMMASNPICPTDTSISPCNCSAHFSGIGVYLNCDSNGLTDLQFSNILDTFLVSGISPLVALSASYNNLTEIPNQIAKFTSLELIDLSINKITTLPAGAFSNPSIKYLLVYLSSNQISAIPSDAFNIPNATAIAILMWFNQITAIPPGMFNYPLATSVSIHVASNQISSIPAGMFNYPTATNVNIVLYGNQITAIPSGMFNYPSATDVAILLDANRISSISSSMFNFPATGSVSLWLDQNTLTSIPQEMFSYPSATQVGILLSSNQITSIPTGMFNYPNATSMVLWLDDNTISSIPAGTINFPIATNVFVLLSSNGITTVGTGTFKAANYSSISFANNKLTQFPSNVYKSILKTVPTASTFDLSSNPIDCSNCNLAWLIRDNRQLLNPIRGGTCSNGTAFIDLNPYGSANCPINC